MSEYIEREAVIAEIKEEIHRYYTEAHGGYCLAEDALDTIRCAPAADVVEVRHGEWEEEHLVVSYYDDDVDVEVYFKCSVCGTGNFCESPYCPNCGAKMDGKDNGDG